MDNEMLEILKSMQSSITRLESKIDDNTKDVKEMKADIKSFKDQFTDYEGKSASNHVDVMNKIDSMQKDLNAMEIVTSKNWNDIAQLKAVK